MMTEHSATSLSDPWSALDYRTSPPGMKVKLTDSDSTLVRGQKFNLRRHIVTCRRRAEENWRVDLGVEAGFGWVVVEGVGKEKKVEKPVGLSHGK